MSDSTPEARAAFLERLDQAFAAFVPHNQALGFRFRDYAEGVAEIVLPYAPHLVGNPDTGVLHGGPISTLLDATSGASVFLKFRRPIGVATLDLRIDYLKPATPERDVVARATCYRLTKHVAFTRAVAFHDDPDAPIASSAGTFILTGRTLDGQAAR
ncbi:MAG: PaaI family thioesterase [Polyangiaceae bacterium]|nr:PaaI family thioesterase [Polyangiaceae bacterium]